MSNLDPATVSGFGVQWSKYDQSELPPEEVKRHFDNYFRIFPWDVLPPSSVGFDLGCGSGRWAKVVAARVGQLHCVEASSEALSVARRNLATIPNVSFHEASVEAIPLAEASMDFGYSLGVLHHVPDTRAGIEACVRKLKPGAPFLVYLYYAFDNRPLWFRLLWRGSDSARRLISRLPAPARIAATKGIAAAVYWPLARTAGMVARMGLSVERFPLSFYRHASYYTMQTDALDRFGTRLEHRFTREQIRGMLESAGLERIRFSDSAPYWCAVGFRKAGMKGGQAGRADLGGTTSGSTGNSRPNPGYHRRIRRASLSHFAMPPTPLL